MEKRLGEILVKTYLGDITDLAVDVIANAANSDLWMGTGVAGVIKDKGGTEIEKEAISLGPIRPGEAIKTTAGTLPSKYVMHCAGMLPGGKATYWKVLSSVQTALSIASTHNLESIAFPAIGAGVGGMKEEQSAKAITDGIYHYSKSPGSVKEITLVGFNKYVHDCFCKAVEDCQE
ncbi:MAG: macro domain-containing protein [Candidatus Thorarchaeota archaeon]|jgi:O-acetyl-ADP-ribose deacetylase (regulator of RNase III)